uniref:Uncharacterized protein n=1 Tax=Porphyridium sordidum TaxID=28024 RepID=A0A1C9CDV2_PORSO|nr:hypothetical protein Psor_049 [Porphyridium sordidum]AOM66524.1 hypothetical protein Psor_049 [Porphyridium sordidum]
MKSLKITSASVFLALLVVFSPSLSYAAQFSLKRLLFATFGIHFKRDQEQFRHKKRLNQYKIRLQTKSKKIPPRKIYILGIDNPQIHEKIISFYQLNKFKKKRITSKTLKNLEQLIQKSNRFEYVKISFNYSSVGEEQIIIYIKMPQPFNQVTILNRAAYKIPHKIIKKAVQPFITAYFDNNTLLNFNNRIKAFYKYLGYDYFFIHSYEVQNNKLIIKMDEDRINQFGVIGAIYFCKNDLFLTKKLNANIPLKLALSRFNFRKNGSINTNYADRTIESLKSDLIVDVCRYEIEHVKGRKSPLDICIFMTSLPERSGFFSIYPEIIPNILLQLFPKEYMNDIDQVSKSIQNSYVDKNIFNKYKNNQIRMYNLFFHYKYNKNYLDLINKNTFFDLDYKGVTNKIKHMIFSYYDLRNLIKKTDHLSIEMDFPYINENFKIIYKDLWTRIGITNLGITKFSFVSAKQAKQLPHFISLNNLVRKSIYTDTQKKNYFLVKQKLSKVETQNKLFDFLSIYNKFACLNKSHQALELYNLDNLFYNYQILPKEKLDFLLIPIKKRFSQTVYLINWASIYYTIQDINSLSRGDALYLDLINIYSNCYNKDTNTFFPFLVNLIKFRGVFFIPFSINPELTNNWSGLFTINLNYILQNSKKLTARSNVFSYANLITDKQLNSDFPSDSISFEIHKRIKSNMSMFGGLTLEKSYNNLLNLRKDTSRFNFSILMGLTVNVPIQDVQPLYIYYGIPICGKTSKIGFKMSLYRSVYQNLNQQI